MWNDYSLLAIGMITCYRPGIDVHATVAELRQSGFNETVHIFCEPETPELRPMTRAIVHRNSTRLGGVGNWAHCLKWLFEHTSARFLLVCEDDIVFCHGARAALDAAFQSRLPAGFWSLYTPERDGDLFPHSGWCQLNRGWDAWGTQAMCFPRESVNQLLDDPLLKTEDRLRGPTDAIVGQHFLERGLPCFYHNPSLTQHVGKHSTTGHCYHSAWRFDPYFDAPKIFPPAGRGAEEKSFLAGSAHSFGGRTAVMTTYQRNIPFEVISKHAEVVCRFLPCHCDYLAVETDCHAAGLDKLIQEYDYDAWLLLDIDCIPLADWVIRWMLTQALAGIVVGAAQRANHIENSRHLYAGPCALAISKATYNRIGRVSFQPTSRGDVAEQVTYACEEAGVPISLLWPTAVKDAKWTLLPNVAFGLGTTYADMLFHAFEIRTGVTTPMFLEQCRKVLSSKIDLAGDTGLSPAAQAGGAVFHEDWYGDAELDRLEAAARYAIPLSGGILEFGCWEGRSTAVIANACFPQPLIAVDTWQGQATEDPEHITVQLARERDVFAIFQENMNALTGGNVTACRQEILEFIRDYRRPIKFCHIDAAHDYFSVRQTIECILPNLVAGGVIFGHDFETASAAREDLQGGVERAVRETLPYHVAIGNTWWYVHGSDAAASFDVQQSPEFLADRNPIV